MSISKMSMKTPIRNVEGLVKINFFPNKELAGGKVTKTSRKEVTIHGESLYNENGEIELNDDLPTIGLFDKYSQQILSEGVIIEKEFACLDGKYYPDGTSYPVSKSEYIGWWGDELSDFNGVFLNPQTILVEYPNKPTLTAIKIRGDRPRGQYPLEFTLTYYYKELVEKDSTYFYNPGEEYDVIERMLNFKIAYCNGIVTISDFHSVANLANLAIDCKYVEANYEYIITSRIKDVVKLQLEITKWSKPNELARINFFGYDEIDEFDGSQLNSLEILEEKTGTVHKLSYGISSNYCKFTFLNEDYKYFELENYNKLSKNREIFPYIRCQGKYSSLGRFYSDDWIVPSDSKFITCKAYDILYSLKDIVINYGMIQTGDRSFKLYKNQRIVDVIQRIEDLINQQRVNNGILGREITLAVQNIPDYILPYTLIEEKTAWDVLQDIANLCCAYIYVNRFGDIIIEGDEFSNTSKQDSGVTIDMDNSFSYSLPVTSMNIVNQVEVSYYDFATSNDSDVYEIKSSDIEIGSDGRQYFTIKFNKLYEEITNISIYQNYLFNIFKATFDSITFALSDSFIVTHDFDTTFTIPQNSEMKKLITKKYLVSDEESIKKSGVKSIKCNAGLLINVDIAQDIGSKIINKYSKGLSYIETDWVGDDALKLGTTFKGDVETNKKRKTYECLSNEIKLSNNFRTKTKGIEVVD